MPRSAPAGGAAASRLAALALALVATACASKGPAGPSPALVPAEALAAAVVESPQGLYAAAKELWKAAAPRSTGSLDEALAGLLPDLEAARDFLDFSRPWALALVPREADSRETRSLVYLPYRTEPDLSIAGKDGRYATVGRGAGYVVLSDVDAPVEFPPRVALDLSRLKRYPAASLKLWLDPAGLARRSLDGYRLIEDAIRGFVSEGRASPSVAARDLALGFLKQIEAADAALIPGARGVELRAGASIIPGGELAQAYAAAASAPSALDWSGRIKPELLYSFAYSMDNAAAADLAARLSQASSGALGMDDEAFAGMRDFQARAAALSGPRGAASLDMDLDPSALTRLEGASPPEIRAAVSQAFSIRLDVAQEVLDAGDYAAFVRAIPSDPGLSSFLDSYGRALGVTLGIEGAEKREDALSYGELRLRYAADLSNLDPLADAETSAAVDAALGALAELFTMRWTTAGDGFYLTTADARALQALATASGAGPASPAVAAYAAKIPGKPFLLGSVSARRLLELATKIAALAGPESGGGPGALPDPARFGAWFAYGSTGADGARPLLEIGLLAPASDLGAIYDAIREASRASAGPEA